MSGKISIYLYFLLYNFSTIDSTCLCLFAITYKPFILSHNYFISFTNVYANVLQKIITKIYYAQ